MRLPIPAPNRATTSRTRKNRGIDWNSSVIRMSTSSTHPPRYPATTPMATPMTAVMAVTPRTTTIDVRAPWITAPNMSRPRLSVPMRWARDGACSGSATVRNGSWGARTSARAAAPTTNPVSSRPATPAGWRRKRLAATRHRAGATEGSPASPASGPRGGRTSAVADAGIDTGVDQVGDQVGEDQAEGDEQDHAQQDRVVPRLGRGQDEAAQAGPAEHCLDQHGAREQEPHPAADHGDHGEQGVAQGVADEGRGLGQPFGLGRAHVVPAHLVEDPRAGDPA